MKFAYTKKGSVTMYFEQSNLFLSLLFNYIIKIYVLYCH